jgi:GNAT superfamily N-acetyltransferase
MSLDPREAAILADDAEAMAFDDLYAAAPEPLQRQLGLRVERIADSTLLLAPAMPTAMFNRAIGLGLRRDATREDVQAIADVYRAAGCGTWWLHWNPFSAPAGMPQMLAEMGFTQPARRSWAKVLRPAQDAPHIATDLRISPASDAQLAAATQAIRTAFDMPPFMADWMQALHGRPAWTIYSVCDGDEVVGGGCLFVRGDLAWLGMGAVLPSHRRRGGQGALMARRIADAGEAGARHVVTETGEPIGDEANPSLANMRRCGFDVVASRLNFAGPA